MCFNWNIIIYHILPGILPRQQCAVSVSLKFTWIPLLIQLLSAEPGSISHTGRQGLQVPHPIMATTVWPSWWGHKGHKFHILASAFLRVQNHPVLCAIQWNRPVTDDTRTSKLPFMYECLTFRTLAIQEPSLARQGNVYSREQSFTQR